MIMFSDASLQWAERLRVNGQILSIFLFKQTVAQFVYTIENEIV